MPILDPTPWVGLVKPFLMTSSSQFRSDGPNALTSNQYAKDFNEVKALGGNGIVGGTPSARTPEQTHNAMFWQSAGGPALLWNDVARDLVEDPGYGVDIDDSALLFAMLNLSGADAAINCWNDKYHFDFWRPWQAIREADGDDNRKTEPDTSWTSFLTAPYPEHPSGHLCLDGAHLTVLRSFFGRDKIAFGVTSSQFGGETRFFGRFSEPLKEIVEARIWAGLHFRTADVQGADLGKNVAEFMEDELLPAHRLTLDAARRRLSTSSGRRGRDRLTQGRGREPEQSIPPPRRWHRRSPTDNRAGDRSSALTRAEAWWTLPATQRIWSPHVPRHTATVPLEVHRAVGGRELPRTRGLGGARGRARPQRRRVRAGGGSLVGGGHPELRAAGRRCLRRLGRRPRLRAVDGRTQPDPGVRFVGLHDNRRLGAHGSDDRAGHWCARWGARCLRRR